MVKSICLQYDMLVLSTVLKVCTGHFFHAWHKKKDVGNLLNI